MSCFYLTGSDGIEGNVAIDDVLVDKNGSVIPEFSLMALVVALVGSLSILLLLRRK